MNAGTRIMTGARFVTRFAWLRLWTVLCVFLAVGLVFVVLNSGLPVARNGLVYEKAALGILENHFDVIAVARDPAWTSGRPILFPLVAAPFINLFGANTAVVIASAFGTAFFLWAGALALIRLSRRAGFESRVVPLAFVLLALNPLVIYQFWSAYPDSLFAGLVLLAFVLSDIIATESERDTRWHLVGLGATTLLAIHAKLYGAILLVTCPLYLLMHGRALITQSSHLRSKMTLLAIVLIVVSAALLLGKLDLYPLLAFNPGAGAQGFETENLGGSVAAAYQSLVMFGFALLLIFHVALLFGFSRKAWRASPAPAALFFSIYTVGLFLFNGTYYNMRYFLAAFPLAAFVLAAGAAGFRPAFRRGILIAYTLIAIVLTLAFNMAPVEERARPLVQAALGSHIYWVDNLRLSTQIDLRNQIDAVNKTVPAGSVLYWLSSYYGKVTHGLARPLGVKDGLDIRYVMYPWDIPPSRKPIFLTEFTSFSPSESLGWWPDWSVVESLENGLFRVVPFYLECASQPCDSLPAGAPLQIRAVISQRFGPRHLELVEQGQVLASAQGHPFVATLRDLKPGPHEIVMCGKDQAGHKTTSSPLIVYVGMRGLGRSVEKPTEISVELPGGEVVVAYEPFAVPEGSTSSVLFNRIDVAPGERVTEARIEFPGVPTNGLSTHMEIQGELIANAATPDLSNRSSSKLRHTNAAVQWTVGSLPAAGNRVRTPDLAPILNEIISQPGWRAGNSMNLFLKNVGRPALHSMSSSSELALPRLYIELESK